MNFCSNSDFRIPRSLQLDDVNLRYSKIKLFYITKFIVWIIKVYGLLASVNKIPFFQNSKFFSLKMNWVFDTNLKGNVHISIQRGGLLTSFLDISLWFFACRPELWSSFWIKHQSGGKIIFPLIFPEFFRHFFKNFVLGPCGASKVINIGSGNSILDFIMHFPFSLYHFLPCPAFSPS